MDFDIDAFYRERDSIMNQPDEDLNEYRKRMIRTLKTHSTQMDSSMNITSFPVEEGSELSLAEEATGHSVKPTRPPEISSVIQSLSKQAAPLRSSGSPSLRHSTTSRVQENLEICKAARDSGNLIIDSIHAPTLAKHLDRVPASPKLIEGENVERVPKLDHQRNKNPGVKRKLSSIELSSPAKRSKGDRDKPIWNDFSIRQTSTPLPLPQIEAPLFVGTSELPRSIGREDNELPSEILRFPSPSVHSLHKQSSSAGSSPISSFSHALTRSPSSGLRQQQQNARKTSSGLKIPYGHLLNEASLPEERKEGVTIRHSQLDHNDPPTSPIEDPGRQEFNPPAAIEKPRKGIIASGSSKLCLEVKERVAKHVAMKQRDKVIPLGSEGVKRGVSVQEETSAVRAPTVLIPPVTSSSHASPAEQLINPKGTRQTRAQPSAPKNKKKEKQTPVSPAEYAQQLTEKAMAEEKSKKPSILFLEGKNIFYIGGDMQFASERTRGRMDLIMKHGGRLIANYDSEVVTHIVTDANRQPTLRVLNYKHLSDIPSHIPTVKWSWVKAGITRLNRLDKEVIKAKLEDMWLHAAFSERMDTITEQSKAMIPRPHGDRSIGVHTLLGTNCESPANQAPRLVLESSSIQGTPSPSSSISSPAPFVDKGKGTKSTSVVEEWEQSTPDPLEEFYAEARELRENSCDESDPENDPFVGEISSLSKVNQGWTCDNKEQRKGPCANQDIIEKLQELQELHKAKLGDEDRWRAFSYNKSIRAIRGYPKRIQSYAEARSIRGVGSKTALKIMEILSTGDLRRINYERTHDVEVTRLYQGIYGVGQSTAFQWYSAGCRTLEDLYNQKGGVRLNPVQLIGLQYYDDINNRMPRAEAKAIFDIIKPMALSIDSRLMVEIMGSYRRGKNDCGDIDILITRPTDDEQTHSGILARLLPMLHKEGIITEDLALPDDYTDLECIYRGLCRLPQPGSRRRRIDFLTVPWKSRGAALLYYTGDDIFNRAMRLKARKMGYSLNQRGLFIGVVRDPKDSRIKFNEGNLVASETEEEIFRILNVPWQEPHERVRG